MHFFKTRASTKKENKEVYLVLLPTVMEETCLGTACSRWRVRTEGLQPQISGV